MTKRRADEITGGAEYALPPKMVRASLEGGCLDLQNAVVLQDSFVGLDLAGTECVRLHDVRFEDSRALARCASAIADLRPTAISLSGMHGSGAAAWTRRASEALLKAALEPLNTISEYAAVPPAGAANGDAWAAVRELTLVSGFHEHADDRFEGPLKVIADGLRNGLQLADLWLEVIRPFMMYPDLDHCESILLRTRTLIALTYGGHPLRPGEWFQLSRAVADRDRLQTLASSLSRTSDLLGAASGLAISVSAEPPTLRVLRLRDVDAVTSGDDERTTHHALEFPTYLASSLLEYFEAVNCRFGDQLRRYLLIALRRIPTLREVDLSGSGFRFDDGYYLVAQEHLASQTGLTARIDGSVFSSATGGPVRDTLHDLATAALRSTVPPATYRDPPPFLRLRRWPALPAAFAATSRIDSSSSSSPSLSG